MKRTMIIAGTLAASLAATGTAFASWSANQTTGTAAAKALSMPTGNTPTAPATSTGSVTLTWTAAQLGGNDLTTYDVKRYSGATATAITCATQTITNHVVSCTYAETTSGTYTYTNTPTQQLWVGTESPKSGNTVVTVALTFTVAVSGNQTAGSAFNVTLTAKAGAATDTTYTGSHTIAFSGPANSPSGQAPGYPATVTFANGVGTANVTLYKAETATLTATETTPSRTGSTSVTVTTAGGSRKLAWTTQGNLPSGSSVNGDGICYFTCDVKAFGRNNTWTSKVSVTDTYGNPVSDVGTGKGVTVTKSGGSFTPTATSVNLTFPSTGVAETTAGISFTSENNNSFTSDDLTATATGFAAGSVPANATTVFRRV